MSPFRSFISSTALNSLPINNPNAYLVAYTDNNLLVGSSDVFGISQGSLAIWGDDSFTSEVDGALEGDSLTMKFVDGFSLYNVIPTIIGGSNFIYTTNSTLLMSGFEIESSCYVDLNLGCSLLLELHQVLVLP